MDYNQMNYNQMQYQPQMSLQTPEQKQTGMFLHLSQLINLIIPLGGIVAPILIWQLKKDEIPALDAHGKMVANWLISALIYGAISFVLTFVLIGILGFIALGIMGIVFPIIGGIKANKGELFEYPLTIKFLK
ncbi:MAG: DUF4870 domain-containing protein [Acidobacteriota bacterium]